MSGDPPQEPDPTTVSAKSPPPERVERPGSGWRNLAGWRDLKDLGAQLLTFAVILLAVLIDLPSSRLGPCFTKCSRSW